MIRILEPNLVNQIAAGEVIERPAAAIKELVENALDAQATEVIVRLNDGGKTYFSVTDNGVGIPPQEIPLAFERFATSKLPESNLFNIHSFGFRGEALPSIGSIARVKMTSRTSEEDTAWVYGIEGGNVQGAPQPISGACGTKIEVSDLFFSVPARLKFLKSEKTELSYVIDILEKIALAHPHVRFQLHHHQKEVLDYQSCSLADRAKTVLGQDFGNNCVFLEAEKGTASIKAFLGLPSYSHSSSNQQFFFVNNRPVKDKILSSALKQAYQDLIPFGRYPAAVIFISLDPYEVDINVHPTKSEVRFREAQSVRQFVYHAVLEQLRSVNTDVNRAESLIQSVIASPGHAYRSASNAKNFSSRNTAGWPLSQQPFFASHAVAKDLNPQTQSRIEFEPFTKPLLQEKLVQEVQGQSMDHTLKAYDLGNAKAQLFDTYIIAEAEDGFVIVDQHAAHERIMYEAFKEKNRSNIQRKALLIPEMVDLSQDLVLILKENNSTIQASGFSIEYYSNRQLVIREMPALLQQKDLKEVLLSLAEGLKTQEDISVVEDKINEVLADWACRHSIRAGQKLSLEEMNRLLRLIETTPYASQCNHGRPTFTKISKSNIAKLFERL